MKCTNTSFCLCVGIGSQTNIEELRGIASDPDGDYLYEIPDFDNLNKITDRIIENSCSIHIRGIWLNVDASQTCFMGTCISTDSNSNSMENL